MPSGPRLAPLFLAIALLAAPSADAITLDVVATADAQAEDSGADGTFDTLATTNFVIISQLWPDAVTPSLERRAIFEFDIGSIPTSGFVIDSVVLSLYNNGSTASHQVHAYAGDGVTTLADATASGSLVGTIGPLPNIVQRLDFSLDPSAVQGLLGVSSFAGFLIRSNGETGDQIQLNTIDDPTGVNFRHPRLIVEYSVIPEPSTGALLALGLAGLAARRGRTQR